MMLIEFSFYCYSFSSRRISVNSPCYNTSNSNDHSMIGIAAVSSVFGGVLSDGVVSLDNFKCALIGGIIYTVGTICTISSYYMNNSCSTDQDRRTVFFLGFYTIAVGTTIFKTNMLVLFAKQVTQFYGTKALRNRIACLYLFFNAGSGIAIFLVLICKATGQQLEAYIVWFSFGASIVSLIILFCGNRVYKKDDEDIHKRPRFVQLFSYLYFHICMCYYCKCVRMPRRFYNDGTDKKKAAKQLAILVGLFASLVMFWEVYSQMNSSFSSQAEKMLIPTNLTDILNMTTDEQGAIIFVFDIALVFILVPFVYFVLYLLERCGFQELSLLKRIGVGIIMMIISITWASVTENVRANNTGGNGDILSVFWLLPECALTAAGEAFAVIAGYEFALTQAPMGLEGTVIGIYLCSWGLAAYVGVLLTVIVNKFRKPWYPSDIDKGHLDYYMFLLAGLVTCSLVVFAIIAREYQYISRSQTGALENTSVRATSSTGSF